MKTCCDCLNEVNLKVKEQTQDPKASIGFAMLMSGETFPRMTYTYRKKKKGGEFHAKETEGTMFPTYCPFCGVKYAKD